MRWWHRRNLHTRRSYGQYHNSGNRNYLISSDPTIWIYSAVTKFDGGNDWFRYKISQNKLSNRGEDFKYYRMHSHCFVPYLFNTWSMVKGQLGRVITTLISPLSTGFFLYKKNLIYIGQGGEMSDYCTSDHFSHFAASFLDFRTSHSLQGVAVSLGSLS